MSKEFGTMSVSEQVMRELDTLREENKMLRNNIAIRINGQDEINEWKEHHYRLLNTICEWREKAEELEAKLSRYESAVRVDGWVDEDGSILFDYEVRDRLWKEFYNTQRVTVLVMPREVLG